MRHQTLSRACFLCLLALSTIVGRSAFGAEIRHGDLIVLSEASALGTYKGALVKVDPLTGAQTLITNLPTIEKPSFIHSDGADGVYVIDRGWNFNGGIYHVNLTTGAQTSVNQGGILAHPNSLSVDPAGNLIVSQSGVEHEANALLKISPTTGQQTLLLTNNQLSNIGSVVVEPSGNYLIANSQLYSPGSVMRMNAVSGQLTLVSEVIQGGLNMRPSALDANTMLLTVSDDASDPPSSAMLSVNTANETFDFMLGSLPYQYPGDLAQDALGALYLVGNNTLYKSTPFGGMSSFASGGFLPRPISLIVFVPEPSTWILACTAAAFCWMQRRRMRRLGQA